MSNKKKLKDVCAKDKSEKWIINEEVQKKIVHLYLMFRRKKFRFSDSVKSKIYYEIY